MKENFELRACQEDGLARLVECRQRGEKKAFVVMATSTGKTTVAALDSEEFRLEFGKDCKVLVLCHSNAILEGLEKEFRELLGDKYSYGFFSGLGRNPERDYVFSTFQSMAQYKEDFDKEEFAYIVVDEAHHAPARTFREVINYFQPQFLLGLTATPDRMDGKKVTDVFGDAVYILDLVDAINAGWVASIDYWLMVDDIARLKELTLDDGEKITLKELNRRVVSPERDEEIVRQIEEKMAEREDPRVIIFCTTIEHAERMSALIDGSTIVHSQIPVQENMERIEAFRNGDVHTIISVDMLNEGVDIPKADVIVFLRSTASPTVFYQQLGRGLRVHSDKDNVMVLDFIANCEHLELIESFKEKVMPQKANNNEAKPYRPTNKIRVRINDPEFEAKAVDIIALIEKARGVFRTWAKEEIVEGLRCYAEENGRFPTTKEIDDYEYLPHSATVLNHFGTLEKAYIATGLDLEEYLYFKKWTAEKIAEGLRRYAKENGRFPTTREIDDYEYLPSGTTVLNHFGTLEKAYVATGLDLEEYSPVKKWTAEKIAEGLRRYAEENGRLPTTKEIDGCEYLPSSRTAKRYFGSLKNARIKVEELLKTEETSEK